MTEAAAIDVKGWCPGALRPMASGDGLIVRVRPWCGAFTLEQADGLAVIAERLGNGQIDLTRRANLQLRGLRPHGLAELHAALERLGLLDCNPEGEAARNVMVGPLSGVDPSENMDVRPIARELSEALASDPRFAALPTKFGWLVDGGGLSSIAGERADVALCATKDGMAIRLDAEWLGVAEPRQALTKVLAAARAFAACGGRGRLRDRFAGDPAPLAPAPKGGQRLIGTLSGAVGLAAAFGRVEAAQLRALVDQAAKAGASEFRLSPWRALYIPTLNGEALAQAARGLGWIVDGNDPVLRVDACPGAPACTSSTVDTRRAARLLALSVFPGSVHVSGCAKGCARSKAADLVLVGEHGRYNVIRNGTPRDRVDRTIDVADVLRALRG